MVDEGNCAEIVINMPQPKYSEVFFKNVECFEQSVKAVIDTGTGISVSSLTFCKKLNLVPSKWNDLKLLVAGELLVAPSGIVELEVKIEGKVIEFDVVTVEINGFDL